LSQKFHNSFAGSVRRWPTNPKGLSLPLKDHQQAALVRRRPRLAVLLESPKANGQPAGLVESIAEFGPGFTEKALRRMMQFAEVFPEREIVAALSRRLSWSHFVEIIPLDGDLKRDFYAEMCRLERRSVRTLRQKIGGMLFERTGLSKKHAELARQELEVLRQDDQLTADLVFGDPYFLDFLQLAGTYSEKDLETAILQELQRFLLELGGDFAFLARQRGITVGQDDFYLDLLFYHRRLHRLIALDLKLEKFTPAHKRQMELYLRWLEKHETRPRGAAAGFDSVRRQGRRTGGNATTRSQWHSCRRLLDRPAAPPAAAKEAARCCSLGPRPLGGQARGEQLASWSEILPNRLEASLPSAMATGCCLVIKLPAPYHACRPQAVEYGFGRLRAVLLYDLPKGNALKRHALLNGQPFLCTMSGIMNSSASSPLFLFLYYFFFCACFSQNRQYCN
jgi:predicted nuclease of restriction endonuclease-like (RecB) superfamily